MYVILIQYTIYGKSIQKFFLHCIIKLKKYFENAIKTYVRSLLLIKH